MAPGGLIAGLTGAVFALACSRTAPPPESSGPVSITVGVPQAKQGDPTHSIATLASGLANQRLSASDASGRATPLLLERWDLSEDGLTWRLTLRPNVAFHDGSPVTPADVVRTLEGIRNDPVTRAPTACFADVTGIAADGERDVVVRMARRCSMFLDDIDYSVSKTTKDGRRIGTGPFVALSSTPEVVTFTANARYYLGKPVIDEVAIRAYDTLREAWAEMLRGQVDFLWEVGPEAAEFLGEQTSVEVRSHLSYFVYTVVLNSARPPFDRPAVRQALNLAIDREALLNQALRGQGIEAASPIWPNHWARPAGGLPLPYAPAEAAAQLRKALGRPQPQKGDRRPVLSFTCLIPQGFTVYERLALLVQQQLRAIDVEMRLEAFPPDTFNTERIGTGDFDAVLIPVLSGPNLAAHYRFWHSPSPAARWNFWQYRSPATDAALDALRDALTDDGVRRAVAQLDDALRADPPGMFLVWSQTIQAVSRRFVVPDSGRGRDALHVLWAWKLSGAGARAP